VDLFTIPFLHKTIFLEQLTPKLDFKRSGTMIAYMILVTFFVQGVCDYLGNVADQLRGASSARNLRQRVFEQGVAARRAVLTRRTRRGG